MTDAVIYNRVSTSDQDVAHQLPACEELCRRRGWTHQVVHETGKRTRARDGWREVLDLVRRRRVRVVVVWAADRIGGLWSIADTVREFDRLGVLLVSAQPDETWLELGGDPMIRDLLVRIFDWLAGWELKRLAARTKAAHETARRKGKLIGRPRVLHGRALEVAIALRKGSPPETPAKSWQEIRQVLKRQFAKDLNKSTIASAVTRILDELAQETPAA
jgi:DNA invertase Pin-like site-specific DNA recombinase